jgi:3-oxoadipate enol-lactonase
MEGVVGFDGTSHLSAIQAKTLLMAGSADPSAVMVRKLVEKVRGAEYHEIDGAKHIANADEADAFTSALIQFLI